MRLSGVRLRGPDNSTQPPIVLPSHKLQAPKSKSIDRRTQALKPPILPNLQTPPPPKKNPNLRSFSLQPFSSKGGLDRRKGLPQRQRKAAGTSAACEGFCKGSDGSPSSFGCLRMLLFLSSLSLSLSLLLACFSMIGFFMALKGHKGFVLECLGASFLTSLAFN